LFTNALCFIETSDQKKETPLSSQKKRHHFRISHKQGKKRNKNSFQNQILQALPQEKPLVER
jgi:hypothetical protein